MKILTIALLLAAFNIGSNVNADRSPGLRVVVDPGVALSDGSIDSPENLIKFEKLLATEDEISTFKSYLAEELPEAETCNGGFMTLMAAEVRPKGDEHPIMPPADQILKRVCHSDMHGVISELLEDEEIKDIEGTRWKTYVDFATVELACFAGEAPLHVELPPRNLVKFSKLLATESEISAFKSKLQTIAELDYSCTGSSFVVEARVAGEPEPEKVNVCEGNMHGDISKMLGEEEMRDINEKRWQNPNDFKVVQVTVMIERSQ